MENQLCLFGINRSRVPPADFVYETVKKMAQSWLPGPELGTNLLLASLNECRASMNERRSQITIQTLLQKCFTETFTCETFLG